MALARETGRRFGGYVVRESATLVRCFIVTDKAQSSKELGPLWAFLCRDWSIDAHEIEFDNNDVASYAYLKDRFQVVQASAAAEPEGWSDLMLDHDDNVSEFSVVSSIP